MSDVTRLACMWLGACMLVGCGGASATALNATMPPAPFTLTTQGPGRVPLVLESSGAPQQIGWPSGTVASRPMRDPHGRLSYREEPGGLEACTTPCTVYLAPGRWNLWSGGESLRAAVWSVDVPATGARVRVHASSPGALSASPFLMLAGALFAVPGALVLAHARSDEPQNAYAGGGLMAAGLAVFAVGAVLFVLNAPTGPDALTPLAPGETH